jgi:hypothetical protein
MRVEDTQILDLLNFLTIPLPPAHAPLFIGWSGRDKLLLSPENAVLALPATQYVRLPVTLHDLQTYFANANHVKPDENYLRLKHPVHQFTWALGELAKDITDHRESFAQRLLEIRRFCNSHWPGWFDNASKVLLDETYLDSLSKAKVVKLAELVDDVAIQHAIAPLVDILLGDGLVSAHIINNLAIMRYSLTAPRTDVGRNLFVTFLRKEELLSDVLPEADHVLQALRDLCVSSEDYLKAVERVESIRCGANEAKNAIDKLLTDGEGDFTDMLHQAHQALTSLLDTAKELARERGSLKAQIADLFNTGKDLMCQKKNAI